VAGFSRSVSPVGIIKNVSAVKKAISASSRCKKLLREINPDVVIGTGGYVSGPVLKTAQKMGYKNGIHEQNAFPGVTTKMLVAGADVVMLAMPEAEKHLKLNKAPVITGNPIRGELLRINREEARNKLGIKDGRLILSFGGSLGAQKVNESVSELIKWHNASQKYYHIHATGKVGYEAMMESLKDISINDKIQIREYITDMDVCMAAADLVICRAGAITLGELQACGKPAILIPSPYVAENHQFHNAMTLKNAGAAEILEEKDLNGKSLINCVETLLNDSHKLSRMSAAAKESAIIDANERIYNEIIKLLPKN